MIAPREKTRTRSQFLRSVTPRRFEGPFPGLDNLAWASAGCIPKLKQPREQRPGGFLSLLDTGNRPIFSPKFAKVKEVGTWFRPQMDTLNSRKHWIAYTLKSHGSITVDPGAEIALKEHGKSLLPKGISKVDGHFQARDMVDIQGPRRHLRSRIGSL